MHTRALLVAALVLSPLLALPAAALPPSISFVDPATGSPGSWFRIFGDGFDNVTSVALGGLPTNHTVKNETILGTVPDLPPGAYEIVVTDDEGSATWCCFDVTEPQPRVDGFTPPSGEAGTWVWVWGDDLHFVTGVAVGGVAASFASGETWLEFVVPDDAPLGHHGLEFAHPGGVLHVCCFEVTDPENPTFHYLSPDYAAPWDDVWIQGDNLDGLDGLYLWGPDGAVALDVLWASTWSIGFRAPDLPYGSYTVFGYFWKNSTLHHESICCLTIDPSLPRADLAVEIVSVEKSTIRTDFTEPVTNPVGTQTITVRVDNLGDADARPADLLVGVVQDGLGYDATWWLVETPRLAPGASTTFTFEWEPGDAVGDATVVARFEAWSQTGNPANDADEEDTFVVVGGLGSANVPLV